MTKKCRCGNKAKSLTCGTEFLCDVKCTIIKRCGRHPCKRKVQKVLPSNLTPPSSDHSPSSDPSPHLTTPSLSDHSFSFHSVVMVTAHLVSWIVVNNYSVIVTSVLHPVTQVCNTSKTCLSAGNDIWASTHFSMDIIYCIFLNKAKHFSQVYLMYMKDILFAHISLQRVR